MAPKTWARKIGIAAALGLAGSLLLSLGAVSADDGARPRTPAGMAKKECGACHLPYLPNLMPSSAWDVLFDRLDNHFGENAKLSADEAAVIRRYYYERGKRGGWTPAKAGALPRITDQPWWKRAMGDRDFDNPRVRTKSNCGGCHSHADYYLGIQD
jgi:mono/diheme cytochrome c family protein